MIRVAGDRALKRMGKTVRLKTGCAVDEIVWKVVLIECVSAICVFCVDVWLFCMVECASLHAKVSRTHRDTHLHTMRSSKTRL